MKVSELMTSSPATVCPEHSLRDAALMMKQHDCGCLPVQDAKNGKLVGVITDRDIVVRAVADGGSDKKVSEVMSKQVHTCRPEDDIDLVERVMAEHQVRRVPVVDGNGKAVGIVAQADIARAANGNSNGNGSVSQGDVARVVEGVSQPGGHSHH